MLPRSKMILSTCYELKGKKFSVMLETLVSVLLYLNNSSTYRLATIHEFGVGVVIDVSNVNEA